MNMSHLKGVNTIPSTFYKRGCSIAEISEYGANCIRLHITEDEWNSAEQGFRDSLRMIIQAQMDAPDMMFVANLKLECNCSYWQYLEWWQKHIHWFNALDNVVAIDIVNEPMEGEKGGPMEAWNATLPVFLQAMRDLTDKTLIVESGWGGRDTGFKLMEPFFQFKDIAYGCHLYSPFPFTHQGKIDKWPTPALYPGEYSVQEYVKNSVPLMIDFKNRWEAQGKEVNLFIGELGLNGLVDPMSAETWIREAAELCDSLDAGWCWHSYGSHLRGRQKGFPLRPVLTELWMKNNPLKSQ